MKHIDKLFAIGLIAIGSVAFAHGAEDHDKKAGASSHEGHASALGRPGDPKKASRTVEITMSDAMRFNPSSISVKLGKAWYEDDISGMPMGLI